MPRTDRERRRHSPQLVQRIAAEYSSTWLEQAIEKERAAAAYGPTGLVGRAETYSIRAELLRIRAQAVQDFARNGGKS